MYETAASMGNGEAAHNLALILLERKGSADQERAVELLKQAVSADIPRSMTQLGALYVEMGKLGDAIPLFRQAADLKENMCLCYQLL